MELITLAHGSGGALTHRLIEEYLKPAFSLTQLNDAALIHSASVGRLAVTTDSFVVSPIFFPGGDIGKLAINGTVNDLAMVGARPLYLTVGLIIEEGFSFYHLKTILASMSNAATLANITIIAGDTKVVEHGKADGLFINTTGIGVLEDDVYFNPSSIQDGDKVILSGPIGVHGIAIMAQRHNLTFNPPLLSDTAPLNLLVQDMMAFKDDIHAMRDPTRGGLATTLKEIATAAALYIEVYEDNIFIPKPVQGACDLFGYDPLYIANEGVLIAFIASKSAESLLNKMKQHPLAINAKIIGQATKSANAKVILHTSIGGKRSLEMLSEGELFPRIC